ncbi:hypothetical protein K8374_09430 [Pseudomonas sp. p1(2021b)]|uniref:hypothetical protein n=1 Tax=Pseudomonas sp. p1(2021b) TaxID=2874628 RepID=UPI001CCD61FB|nr:hypothetical protein [Pseudomonas sp. p1(2021b)]UBM27151.1 hypothetical protein K8374_09430 [Pseudomonas sp. p1(2021b)]
MTQPERITLVLRPVDGGSLAPILPFLKLGDEFQAEGFTAVIAGVSEGDLQEHLAVQDRRLSIISRKATEYACQSIPTGRECRFGDEIAALACIGDVEKGGAAFDIDEHVRMAADARRYRWLRDRERIEDPDEDLLVVRGDNWLSGEELDQEIDTALRVQTMQQQAVQEHQP